MAVCMDDMATQLMLMVLIIDHLAVVHQGLDACDEVLGVLSQPGHNIFKFSKVHMGVDIMCHSLVYSVKEGISFHLGHSLLLFTASRHPLCVHLQGFGSQGCKNVSGVVLTVRHDAVEEEPVLQGMPKYKERVICIFQVPVIDGQADGCTSSGQCAGNGISCGLGRLGDQLLWVLSEDMSQMLEGLIMVRSEKNQESGHKSAYISRTISQIDFKLEQNVDEGVPYH